MKRLFLILILFISHYSFSQGLEWLDYTTNNESEIIADMVVDETGNIIQLIQSNPTMALNPAGPFGFSIRKIDDNGVEQWFESLDNYGITRATSIDTDSNGNIFILSFQGVLKLNPNGEFQVLSTIGCAVGDSDCTFYTYPQQIRVDNDDNVLFAIRPLWGGYVDIDPSENIEYFHSCCTGSYNFRLIKWTNELDNLIWQSQIYGSQNQYVTFDGTREIMVKAISFDIDSNNNIYVASTSGENIILSKISDDGSTLNQPYSNIISGFGYNNIGDISMLSDNEFILGGNFVDYIDLNPIESNQSEVLSSDYDIVGGAADGNGNQPVVNSTSFLVKYDTDFNVKWKKKIDGYLIDSIEDIETHNGNVYVAGMSEKRWGENISPPNGFWGFTHWLGHSAYLKIYNTQGDLLNEHNYISPYPECPVDTPYELADFSITRPYISTGTTVNLMHSWPKRTLSVFNDQVFYIGGEYSAFPPTTQCSGWNLYNQTMYNGGFDWDACSVNPIEEAGQNDTWSHSAGDQTIPLDGFIRPYVAKYGFDNCYNPSMEASIFIDGGNATLSIEIENFIVGNGNGDGHWNFSLNGETEVLNYSTGNVFLSNLTNGDHTIIIWLVDNENNPLSPPIEQIINFSTFDGTASCGELVTYNQIPNGDFIISLNTGSDLLASVTVDGELENNYDFIYITNSEGTILND